MADPDRDKPSWEEVSRMLQDLNKDLEGMLEEMEKLSVKATWVAYDMVATRSNPVLMEQLQRLEEAFKKSLEEVDKNWKKMLEETKPAT